MSTLSSASGLAAKTVGGDLSDTGGNFDNLVSGNGTTADEAIIVHALSGAVTAAVNSCGPSPDTRYAPAQEQALDALAALPGGDTSGLSSLIALITSTKTDLAQEKKLAALGPQGDGGGCTVAMQMTHAAQGIFQGDQGQFSQHLDAMSQSMSSTPQAVANVQADISNLERQGLTPPAGVAAAITTAEKAASQLKTSIDADIDTENSLVVEAYSMANSVAKTPSTSTANGTYSGSCLDNAPGQPAPLQHIG
jgi:hypothetical protein